MNNKDRNCIKNYLCQFDKILCVKSNELLSCNNTKSITINFINSLSILNSQIICMCNNVLKYTDILALCQVIQNIIINKKQEICQSKQILCNKFIVKSSDEDIKSYITNQTRIIEETIVNMKDISPTENISQMFILQMIENIKGLISMCNNVLSYDIDEDLVSLVNYIIMKSNNNIVQLEQINRSIVD